MKIFNLLLLSSIIINVLACEKDEKKLTDAKPFQIVGEHAITLDNDSRNAKMWFITSDASNFDEFAQTVILAAIDLHKNHRNYDLIEVLLVPDKYLIAVGTNYASAFYAVDKKGAKDVSGADQQTMTNFKWLVRSAEKPLNNQELEIARLWYTHQSDFPSEDLLSSLSYNREKLVGFIADSLKLEESEVALPIIQLLDYTELDFLKE